MKNINQLVHERILILDGAMGTLIQQYDLSEKDFHPKKVKILFSQHTGAPSIPNVQAGDSVAVGQVIAVPAENALSNTIHASINGKVLLVNKEFALIEEQKEA